MSTEPVVPPSPDAIEATRIAPLTEYESVQAAAVFHELNRRGDPYALTRTVEHILKMRALARPALPAPPETSMNTNNTAEAYKIFPDAAPGPYRVERVGISPYSGPFTWGVIRSPEATFTAIAATQGDAERVRDALNGPALPAPEPPPLQPILASVDCHDCTARSGEFHDDGCATYALYTPRVGAALPAEHAPPDAPRCSSHLWAVSCGHTSCPLHGAWEKKWAGRGWCAERDADFQRMVFGARTALAGRPRFKLDEKKLLALTEDELDELNAMLDAFFAGRVGSAANQERKP